MYISPPLNAPQSAPSTLFAGRAYAQPFGSIRQVEASPIPIPTSAPIRVPTQPDMPPVQMSPHEATAPIVSTGGHVDTRG